MEHLKPASKNKSILLKLPEPETTALPAVMDFYLLFTDLERDIQ